MNRVFLISMLLLLSALAAAAKEGEAPKGEQAPSEPTLRINWDPTPAAATIGAAAGQPKARIRQRRDTAPVPRAKMSGSTTGYVDNAIIGSQVRFRFDAGFGNETPDLAEFFYAKCGCYREVGADPGAAGPAPKLNGRNPNTTRFIETGLDYREFHMNLEYAPAGRFSLFSEIPVRSIVPTVNAEATGIGDVRAGFKVGLVASPDQHLTLQLRGYFPSGDSFRGLGTDHYSVEPSLLYYKRFEGRAAVGAEFGVWHPVGGATASPVASGSDFSGNVLRYGLGLSYDLAARPGIRFAPVVELVGWHVLGGYVSQAKDGTLSTFSLSKADGTNIVNVKIGARFTFSEHNSIYAGYGRALTKAEWYDEIVRLEYRYAF